MLLRHSLLYGFARLFPGLAQVALLTSLTHILTTDEVGTYTFIIQTVILIQSLTMTWFNVSLNRLLQRSEDQSVLLGNALSLFFVIVGITSLVVAVSWFFIPNSEYKWLLFLAHLFYITYSWMELALTVMAARLQAERRVLFAFSRSSLVVAICAGLAWIGWGTEGLLIGWILGNLLAGIVIYALEWRSVTFHWQRDLVVEFSRFGLPLALSFSMGYIAYSTDRYMITALEGVAVFGLYAVGFEIANRFVQAIMAPIGAAALPLTIKRLETEGPQAARDQLANNLVLLFGLGSPVVAGLISVTPELLQSAVAEEYWAMGQVVLPIMAAAIFIHQIQCHFVDHAFHLGMKTGWHTLIAAFALISNIILNYVLIQRLGAVGAAYSTIMAASMALILAITLSRRAFALPFPVKPLMQIVAANLAMVLAVSTIPIEAPLPALFAKAGVGAVVYAGTLLAFDVMGVRTKIMGKAQALLGQRA